MQAVLEWPVVYQELQHCDLSSHVVPQDCDPAPDEPSLLTKLNPPSQLLASGKTTRTTTQQGHIGFARKVKLLFDHNWWSSLYLIVQKIVTICFVCVQAKTFRKLYAEN